MTFTVDLRRKFIALALVALGLIIPPLAATSSAKDDLDVTGIVDRPSLEVGETLQLLLNITNPLAEPVKLDSIKALFGEGASCEFAAPLLESRQTSGAKCRETFKKAGPYNVGVQVLWTPQGKNSAQQSTVKILSQIVVTLGSSSWMTDTSFYALAAAIIFLVAGGIAMAIFLLTMDTTLAKKTELSRSQTILRFLALVSTITIFIGLILKSPTVVLAGVVAVFASVLLIARGTDYLTRLMDRLIRAGPFEFSPLAAKTQDVEIFELRELELQNLETTIDEILEAADRIDFHIELFRLKAYCLEAALVRLDPPVPGDSISDRKSWLAAIATKHGDQVDPSQRESLEALYNDMERHQSFKDLFTGELKRVLTEAKTVKEEGGQKVLDAVRLLEDKKAVVFSPHFFTTLARLYNFLKKNEKALALLYEGRSEFPKSLNSNVFLGYYVGELNNNYATALKYECKALEIAKVFQKEIGACYRKINKATNGSPQPAFADHLKRKINDHEDKWKTKLRDWLGTLQIEMSNNVAHDIATAEIAALERSAAEYAEAAHRQAPENPAYTETLGLVKLRFAYTQRGNKEEDVKSALRLFDEAVYLARDKNDTLILRIAQLHRQQAIESLQRH